MEENTNSTGAEEVGETLFDDAAEETTEVTEKQDVGEEAADEAAETEEPTTEQPAEQTVKVKYNGEEKDVPMSEVVTLAQKGLNYDKLQQRYEALRNSEELQLVNEFARQNNMSVAQYVKFAKEQQHSTLVQTELSAIMEKDPEIDPDIAKELAESRASAKASKEAQRAHDEELQPWEEFVTSYPELGTDVKKLPEDVQAAIANGETPVHAMRLHELSEARKQNAELQKQLEAEKKNKQNKQASTGSAKSSGKAEKDPFLDGFLT